MQTPRDNEFVMMKRVPRHRPLAKNLFPWMFGFRGSSRRCPMRFKKKGCRLWLFKPNCAPEGAAIVAATSANSARRFEN